MQEFFEFKTMVSSILIKVLYVLGVLVVTIYGIISLFSGSFMMGLGTIIFGNLFWRLFCEGIIVVFSIHDRLSSIDSKTAASHDPRSGQF
ncbi:MAG: DUF4282 domain-containing protein [Melioribacteraceae bacterium]|jgi:hypothetical protein|nr:DUF4282 domain-containing protein [Melioribacteraceae bacterium]RJP56948.1 MAG: DUF4282 domain-containing protein [Ignavibacteriales bacterium]WKZ68271.1 MAG: DUF4282 domain-containing protein [Melioribacteraceae bacterium]